MTQPLRLCLCLHNHQPIGNFDHVFEASYQDSYRLFLDVFERFPGINIGLHTSGCLLEWLEENHPEYVERLAALVAEGRIEIVGGAYYESILTMIPRRDRVGQIRAYADFLRERFQTEVTGMWMPERVWEPSLVCDIAEAGMRWTILDDFHFKAAGLTQDELHGYYVTEDEGRLLSIFPGSEPLRYLLPFGDPQATIDYLGRINMERPGAVVMFGDDGEKFGSWPDTRRHVYDEGWLERMFGLLQDNAHWIRVATPSEAHAAVGPTGKIYLPECSYREMTEWALPVARQHDLEDLRHEFEHDARWSKISPLLRGGFWRNFKVRYEETAEMYARMLLVSQRVEAAAAAGLHEELVSSARRSLFRGQCNCGYWHGAFGGVYLPHLRNAVYGALIEADNLLDAAEQQPAGYIEATAADYNLDSHPELRLVNRHVGLLLAPFSGGMLYEFDVKAARHNLLATMRRRPEAYHRKVLAGGGHGSDECASIHDRVVFKQDGLDQALQYDTAPRKSLIDHFLHVDASLETVARGQTEELGDFVEGVYEAKLRRNPGRVQAQLSRQGHADGANVRITKGVTLSADSHEIEIAYLLEGLPQDRQLHFAVELNFAGMPAGADDRYFFRGGEHCEQPGSFERLGQLGEWLDLPEGWDLGLADDWLGLRARLASNQPTHFWAFPIAAVSQSEGGFELIHQSVAVLPHWYVRGDAHGRWSVVMRLAVATREHEAANTLPDAVEELAATP